MSGHALETQSLRPFIAALDAAGDLIRVTAPVDLEYELAAYLYHLDRRAPVVFENVAGHSLKVAGNLLSSRAGIAAGLGVEPAGLRDRIVTAVRAPLKPVTVPSGPCQEVEVADPDLSQLPVPTFFAHETGPYITAGAIVATDTATGRGNLSIARLKPIGANRAFIGIAPNHHLAVLARAAKARGERLEIAVTIGNHPAVMMASALYLGLGEDELHVAGALLGAPVAVVDCKSVALRVPAACEIVLEGTLDPDSAVEEGAVSEFHGYYERYGAGQVVTFHRLTRRHDAIYQCILPGYGAEHVLIGAVSIAAGLARHLADAVPSFHDVAVTPGGAGRLHAVISLAEPPPGAVEAAMSTVWDAVSLIKLITVVDAEIDPWDPVRVEWAVATCMRPERDLTVVEGARADRAEPLERDRRIAKLGIDATRKAGDRDDWTPARPPEDVLARVARKIAALTD